MKNKTDFSYQRPTLIPFCKNVFVLGPYSFIQINFLLFKNYGIQKAADPKFDISQYLGTPFESLLHNELSFEWVPGSGGYRFQWKSNKQNYTSSSKLENTGKLFFRVHYTCQFNGVQFASFTLEDGVALEAYGFYDKSMEEHLWFIGAMFIKFQLMESSD